MVGVLEAEDVGLVEEPLDEEFEEVVDVADVEEGVAEVGDDDEVVEGIAVEDVVSVVTAVVSVAVDAGELTPPHVQSGPSGI